MDVKMDNSKPAVKTGDSKMGDSKKVGIDGKPVNNNSTIGAKPAAASPKPVGWSVSGGFDSSGNPTPGERVTVSYSLASK